MGTERKKGAGGEVRLWMCASRFSLYKKYWSVLI